MPVLLPYRVPSVPTLSLSLSLSHIQHTHTCPHTAHVCVLNSHRVTSNTLNCVSCAVFCVRAVRMQVLDTDMVLVHDLLELWHLFDKFSQ